MHALPRNLLVIEQRLRQRLEHFAARNMDLACTIRLEHRAALEPRDDELKILDLVVDAVDLAEDRVGLAGRRVAAALAVEQTHADRRLRVLHHAADAGRRHI